ncbi:Fibroblast growth factor receptor substrate 2 [Acipenser ruthenus]|uniref:Fibroblast growth factor receptor substrate 2 n=1 Tax=Acipenser ruthenus TaxID=7906 RepID=A0A662YLR4_ACIRT|nr:Fibroblast growth factor receptor substrate 2 [Acipenser ruthenus]
MGSCCSCPDKESLPDNHQSKFKVINVDDDGNELGSGIMELTEAELILHTRKREAVRWPYLCLRRYGYDSNLFSFESGRRCQTGQGIFAFKCARAEEIFNMLQEIMQNNSISVVEEPVMERNHNQTDLEAPRTPRTPTTPLTLDPNTAHPRLILSEDLTSVRRGDEGQQLPDNPERFDHWGCVLGSEGFTSGKHCWDVELGSNTKWDLGVTKESSQRKGGFTLSPEAGYWFIALAGEDQYWACTSPLTRLTVEKKPQKIRVQLDCDGGEVAFFDSSDMRKPLYTFKHRFTERMFPYFWTGCSAPLRVHTYVNTTGMQEERRNRPSSHMPLELRLSNTESIGSGGGGQAAHGDLCPAEEGEPQVLLEPEGVKFILGPTPVQRQLMEKEKEETGAEDQASGGAVVTGGCVNGVSADSAGTNPTDWDTGYDSDERKEASSNNKLAYEKLNGFSLPSAPPPRRGRIPTPNGSDSHNANNSAQRRTALLNYENLPSLPPVWEVSKPSKEEEEDSFGPKTPALNGYHNNLDPMHNYVNTENVTVPQSANKPEVARRRDCTPTVFNFDFRRPSLDHRQLNYIEVEMERGSDSSNPQTPKTPTTPLPQTPTRRTELYSVIDIERTAAMSSLQKALPRDDGTSRKTRHNSTDLPM